MSVAAEIEGTVLAAIGEHLVASGVYYGTKIGCGAPRSVYITERLPDVQPSNAALFVADKEEGIAIGREGWVGHHESGVSTRNYAHGIAPTTALTDRLIGLSCATLLLYQGATGEDHGVTIGGDVGHAVVVALLTKGFLKSLRLSPFATTVDAAHVYLGLSLTRDFAGTLLLLAHAHGGEVDHIVAFANILGAEVGVATGNLLEGLNDVATVHSCAFGFGVQLFPGFARHGRRCGTSTGALIG